MSLKSKRAYKKLEKYQEEIDKHCADKRAVVFISEDGKYHYKKLDIHQVYVHIEDLLDYIRES